MKTYRIAAIPGDGIGKEVLPEGIRVMEAAGKKFEYKIYENAPGGHAFNRIDTKLAKESRAEIWRFLAPYLNPPNPVK